MKRILTAAVLLAVAAAGCASYQKVKDDYGRITTVLTGLRPAVTNLVPTPVVENSPIPLPVCGDHGEGRRVLSPDGADAWIQYDDGYWHKEGHAYAGFVECLDEWSLEGWGYVIENSGGRNCGRAAITNVTCKVLSRSSGKFLDGTTGAPTTIPDKVEWTVHLDGGWIIVFEHRHDNDCLGGPARIVDVVKDVHADHTANGYRCGNSRCYDKVTANGREYNVGIRMVDTKLGKVRGR